MKIMPVMLGLSLLISMPVSADVPHGMPSAETMPEPQWYVEQFSFARGVGEAVRQARLAQLDKDTGEWTYHIGGVLIARYHPWKHYLTIHTENSETPQAICRWAENGSLTLDPAGAMPTAVEQGACNALLHELARRFPVTETAKVNTSPRPATP